MCIRDRSGGVHKSGERLLRITDSSTNDSSTTTSVAETIFHAKGLLDGREAQSVSTRPSISRREDIKTEEIVSDAMNRSTTSNEWLSPLTQTFTVDKNVYYNGVYVNSLDLFFRQKQIANTTIPNLPVTVQIRPVSKGLPSSSTIIPGAEKTLTTEAIFASAAFPSIANAACATTFDFDMPVYLPPDEYAICIQTNSMEYQVWTGREGDTPLSPTEISPTYRIPKQPNIGTLYRPNNTGVMSPVPSETLMFRVNACKFAPTNGTLYLYSNAFPLSANTANTEYDAYKSVSYTHLTLPTKA